jgi:hypothetical protein
MSTEFIAGVFKTNTGLFKMTTKEIPPDRWFLSPSDNSNHMMWIAGHVLVHRAAVLKILGEQWSAPWEKLFLRGSSRATADQYPPIEEVTQLWDQVADRLATSLASAPDAVLAKPVAKGPTFDGKVSGQIGFLSLHESYHLGQMAYLRKWLGHGQTIG